MSWKPKKQTQAPSRKQTPGRKQTPSRKQTGMTKYVLMSLASHDIGTIWGHAAYVFSWILVQGYVVFPSVANIYDLQHLGPPPAGTSALGLFKREIYYLIQNVPLYGIAWGAVIIGFVGMSVCLMRWRRNYFWGVRAVVAPGLYAASTGLVSTLASIWVTQGGVLTGASKLTLFVTGGATAFFFILWIIYHILLKNAKKKHIHEVDLHVGLGQNGEGRIQAAEPVTSHGERNDIAQSALDVILNSKVEC